MKKTLTVLMLIILTGLAYSQNASTYFPSAPGYKWYFKNTPLDSLNNPQTSQSTFQIDSFATNTTYKGLAASLVLSKTGLTNINQSAPFTDSNYYNFQSTNASYYLNILGLIGSLPIIDSVAFIEFLRSFEAWYSAYRFAQSVNSSYTLFTKDTTINVDSLTLPLRIYSTGKRLNDQVISTVNGNYTAKKFLMTFGISYGLLPPILYIPIVTQADTMYFAQDVWLVRECRPSVNVDLTAIGFPLAFTIPGALKELTTPSTGIVSQNSFTAVDYSLAQNYPNPFNPSTNLEFGISNLGFVSLKVYNSLGIEVADLVNETKPAGRYKVTFDGSNLSSGIYFYKLETGDFTETKSMILLK